MPTIPALTSRNHPAVDARPLLAFGLLDFIDWSATDHPDYSPNEDLFNWLGDERVYSLIVRSLYRAADLAAGDLADQLGQQRNEARKAIDVTMTAWHLALWRLFDDEVALVHRDVATTVLAPVRPAAGSIEPR
ncbi:MAG: hypothetical protein AAF547_12385 [Actinomycetota bacterium]